ncbi:alpha/beta family hydrolase [Simiduia aestuariiviva]|nr:alpha/beta family hydrolase [Simiduia aestuariiviva]
MARLLLAHGAGAPMDSDFMTMVAEGLSRKGIEVVRFEFPYMAERRLTGKRRPPNPIAAIVAHFGERVDRWQGQDLPLFVGGKSMGGRAAAMLSSPAICATLAFGFPLHPAGKPERLRLAPLQQRDNDLLVVQGDRDALGDRQAFESIAIDKRVSICWLPDGDHDLKPRKRSGHSHEGHMAAAIDAAAQFIEARITD